LLLVALFYAGIRTDLWRAFGADGGGDSLVLLGNAGRRAWDALRNSLCAPIFPIALVLPLLLRRKPSRSWLAQVAFCAAWFALGILLLLDLLPVKSPQHIQWIRGRYLFLPLAACAWLLTMTLDLCAAEFGTPWTLILALLALAPSIQRRWQAVESRPDELSSIEIGLAQCGGPSRPGDPCALAGLSLPLVRQEEPEALSRMREVLDGLWPKRRASEFMDFFSAQPFDGQAPKWRCVAQLQSGLGGISGCIEAFKNFEAGCGFFDKGQYAAATAAYGAATQSWPHFTEAYFYQAMALSSQHDFNGAMQRYDRSLQCPMSYYHLTEIVPVLCPLSDQDSCRFLDLAEAEPAIDAWHSSGPWIYPRSSEIGSRVPLAKLIRWLQFRPQDPDLWLDLAEAAFAEKKRPLTLEAAARAEKLGLNREKRFRLALLYQGIEDYAKAFRTWDGLTRDDPRDARYWNGRGVALILLGNPARALADLERAVSIDPDFLPAYLSLGGIHESLGQRGRALLVYEQALKRRRTWHAWGQSPNILRVIRQEKEKLLTAL
jgi:tetratricopeptide (TPR) repeat protein